MNFRTGGKGNQVDVNLTPLIDVVFLLLIFFMVSTSFRGESEIEVNLPSASDETFEPKIGITEITIDKDNNIYVAGRKIDPATTEALRAAMKEATLDKEDPEIVVNADSEAQHQSVVRVMDAARQERLHKLTFSTKILGEDEGSLQGLAP